MPRERPIGIDLGTTFSAVAWVDDAGRTAMIRNAEGDLLTPSVVLFSDEETAVGKEARTATTVHPDLVAEWVKRDMGQPYYERPIRGQKVPPEVIQSCILRKLKLDAINALGECKRVVITVPAYFDEPRRKATADAAELAGLKLLDIVNEPTAAALAFGESLGYLSSDATAKHEMTVFAYDLGGGTFDATLLRLAPGNIRTLATDGDVQLGGHDWDLRLVDYVADQIQKARGSDPRKDAVAMNRVLAAVIDAKHTLSVRRRAIVRVDMRGHVVEVPVTRDQFQEMTADLLERTAFTTRQLLAAAKLRWKDVSRLLLVGGSTRMPMVVNMLRQLSGLEPDHTVNPDEAVARGAALYAAYLMHKEAHGGRHEELTIINVNSHSLGIEGIHPETLEKTNVVLIPRNTPLPAKMTQRFATKTEGQQSIAIQIMEGESSLPSECTAIGRTVIRHLPEALPKKWPVEVTFEYGANGRLTVRAMVPGTGQNAVLKLERAVNKSRGQAPRPKPSPVVSAAAAARSDELGSMVHEALEGLSAADLEEIASSTELGGWVEAGETEVSPPPEERQSAPAPARPAGRAPKKGKHAP
jgi:molecular chaperone DnaK